MVALDLRWALRNMRRHPGPTAAVVLSLALAIGGNTAIFSFVNGILLRPLAVRDLDEVVRVRENWGEPGQEPVLRGVNAATYRLLRQENRVFDGISAAHYQPLNLTGQGEAEELAGAEVTADFFQTLGVEPLQGRTFLPEEEKPGRDKSVLIGEGLWERRFGADPHLMGKALLLNGEQRQVVGIIPRRLKHPYVAEMWVPMVLDENTPARLGNALYVPARLKPGVTVERAEREVSELIGRLVREGQLPQGPQGAKLVPLREELMRNVDSLLYLLFAGAAFVLLIACANVSNLLLAQSLRQSTEAAVRVALGAGGRRLSRLFLTQSLLLAMCGGALGVLLAWWSLEPIVALSPLADTAISELGTEVQLDLPTLIFTFLVTAAVGLALGLVPAFNALRLDPQAVLRQAGRSSSLGRGGRLYLSALVVSEVALAVVLLLAAGMVAQSFIRLYRTDWGFRTDHLLVAELHFPEERYPEAEQGQRFVRAAVERLRALPGVVSVGGSSMQPFSNGVNYLNFNLAEQPAPDPPGYYSAHLRYVTPDYLRTMGIPLLQGRTFVEHDGSRPREGEVIVSQSLARRFWPGRSALAKRLHVDQIAGSPWLTVVGVAGDLPVETSDAYLNLNGVTVTCYVPYTLARFTSMNLMIRVSEPPAAIVPAVRAALRQIDPDQPIANIATMEQQIYKYMSRDRFSTFLYGSFGMIGLALAILGIYAVLSFFVAQQNREIGIRMAMGAQPTEVRNLVLRQAALLTGLGLLVGGLAAVVLKRFAASLLHGIAPGDLTLVVFVLGIVAGVALVACYLPARRATRVDPVLVLHDS
jgi:putative ABC transport system permease protein